MPVNLYTPAWQCLDLEVVRPAIIPPNLPVSFHHGHGGRHMCLMLAGRWRAAQTWSSAPSHQSIYGRHDHTHHN